MTLVLSNAEVAEVVSMQDCVDSLEDAFLELAEGRGAFRRRSDICTPTEHESGGMYALKSMDGVIPKLGVGAIRINSDILTFPEINGFLRRVKVPAAPNKRYTGLVLLFSTKTGEPLAIFPDGMIQPMRVAATSALGAKCLSRENAEVVTILGSGWQARSQVRAIACVRDLKEIRCYSTRKEMREAFAKEMSPIVGQEIKVFDTPEAAVKGADIVLAATNAIVPVFKPEWIEKGMHLSTIKPGEFGPEVVRRADVAATLMEDCDPVFITSHGLEVPEEPGGELQDLANEVGWKGLVTLPELLLERKHGRNVKTPLRGRSSDDQVTCFLNPLGLGYQFAAVGAVIYKRAKEQGRGHELPTDWFTELETP
jgi:ornithine cyclodeaminase/alanine dehydrogenase-like protein (mu-crystallin family)